MVSAVLPLYLVLHLGFTPLHFGLVDGAYQGVSALRVSGGLIADRGRRYKEVAGFGYALSAACKLGLWSAGSAWLPTLGFLFLDRTGKGVRTPGAGRAHLAEQPARGAGRSVRCAPRSRHRRRAARPPRRLRAARAGARS